MEDLTILKKSILYVPQKGLFKHFSEWQSGNWRDLSILTKNVFKRPKLQKKN